MEIIGLIVAIIAMAVSITSAIISRKALKEQIKISQLTANHTSLLSAGILMEKHIDLFNFHNVDEKLMEECGIEPYELLYLIESFTAGELYHRIDDGKSIRLGNYRKNLLSNEKVQKAWVNIIRDKFSSYPPYAEAVDKFIKGE